MAGILEQLTSLASLLDNPNVLKGLNESKSNEEIYQLLNQSTKGEK
jgi:PTS system ascorbate-specific IIA component